MIYNETGFRAVYHNFCVFPLTENLRDTVEGFPGAADADLLLTYGYIDPDAGVTLEILAAGKRREDGYTFYDTADSIRSVIRMETVAEEPFERLPLGDELRARYADKIDTLCAYDVPEKVEEARRIEVLDLGRHPFYPDDLMVYLRKEGLQPEGCWARVIGLDETWIKGRLLNEPEQDFGWHEGDAITFGLMEMKDGTMRCCAMPGLDRELESE